MRALGKGSVASVLKVGLDLLRWLLWSLAGLVALIALGSALVGLAVELGWISPPKISGEVDVEIGGVEVRRAPQDLLTWPVVVTALAAVSVGIGGALVVVGRLRRLFANFCSGEPFQAENADHLRWIWMTLAVVELSRWAFGAALLTLIALQADGTDADLILNGRLDLSTWAAILVLIVLAEVFREGARLREAERLTI